MYEFPDSAGLQRITREIFERGDVVSSVCHGYCGLLNTNYSLRSGPEADSTEPDRCRTRR